MSRLSVLCITREPAAQVQSVLGPLRALASQIVVVADDRVSDDELAGYAAVADVVHRYRYDPPFERALAWAHSLCVGDWILRLDGDELPTEECVAAIAEAIQRRDRTQWWVRRRWVWPDAGHWIDARPWCADFQLRLVRNDPALLSFDGVLHSTARAAPSAGFIEAPLYHLDLVVQTPERRRAKAEGYDAGAPQLVAPGGRPMEIYYLPERWLKRPPVPVPDRHRLEIQAALRGEVASPRPRVPRADFPLASRAEIDASWDARPLRADECAAEIEVIDSDLSLVPGALDELTLRVRNTGNAVWPGGLHSPLIRVGCRWLDSTGAILVADGGRAAFPCRVAPGEQVHVRLPVKAPNVRGPIQLEMDLVHEHVRWFGDPTRVMVRVT